MQNARLNDYSSVTSRDPFSNIEQKRGNKSIKMKKEKQKTVIVDHTEHDYSSCSAASFGDYVAGQAGVVGGVREPGFIDDQIVVSACVNVIVSERADQLLVFQPLHLRKKNKCQPKLLHSGQNAALEGKNASGLGVK